MSTDAPLTGGQIARAPSEPLVSVMRVDEFFTTFRAFSTVAANGQVSVALPVTLPRNAVVERFVVRVGARRADHVMAAHVAEVRGPPPGPASAGGAREYVVDLGMMRTVAGLGLVEDQTTISAVTAWNGIAFAPAVFPFAGDREPSQHVTFSEIRTERLKVLLSTSVPEARLREMLYLTLPDAPAGLELRIDDGPPVWSHPGPVQPGTAEAPSQEGWTAEGHRLVDLTEPLGARFGDPAASGDTSLELRLSARVPGQLGLDVERQEMSRIGAVALPGGAAQVLDFAGEGRHSLPLPVPGQGARALRELQFTVAGRVGPERVLPPVGPPASDVAELVADPDHAFAVRLPGTLPLSTLTAARLPVAAGPDGAEARVVLWTARADGEPGEPLPDGTGDPVALAPQSAGAEAWTTFSFPRPVAREAGAALWLALVVARGEVVWRPLDTRTAGAELDVHELRRSLPEGAWGRLPSPFRDGGELATLRGRVRVVGLASREAPLAPLNVQIAGGAAVPTEVTPTPEGARVVLRPDPPRALAAGAGIVLEVTSRTGATLTLRDPVAIWKPASQS